MSPLLILGGLGLVVLLIVVGSVVALRFLPNAGGANSVQSRLDEFASRETPMTLEEIEFSQPFTERVVIPVLQTISDSVARFTPKRSIEKARRDIEMAGRPIRSAELFFGVKSVFSVIMGGLAAVIAFMAGYGVAQTIGGAAIGVGIGFILPGVWLGGKIRARQDDIIKSMPDVLDLLVICVEAGLGFEAAMAKVAEKWDNEIATAFARVLQEIRLGVPRSTALRDMEKNMGVADMTSFVAAVIQATTFGVSIAKVLRIQSEQMRMKRRQRAEQKAQQAPIKMLFPMVFLIFPALFIVLLGPAVLLIMESGVMGAI